ncbi:uncharacterized protein LOC112847707 [Tachysurus ichikawai]
MFGHQPRLPVDIAFCLPVRNGAPKSHSQYVKTLKVRLQESYQIARRNSQKVAEQNKRCFDKSVRESTLVEGDQVLVRNLQLLNKHKFADKWESTMYKVLEKMGDLPVYKVQPINGDGLVRTLHRDHLLPCGDLSLEVDQDEPKACWPRTRSAQLQHCEVESEDEDDLPFYSTQLPEKRFVQVYEIPNTQQLGKPTEMEKKKVKVHIETNEIGEATGSIRREPGRSRRPPGRFTYPQLGKPLISFAQKLLNSLNQALDTFGGYDISPIEVV